MGFEDPFKGTFAGERGFSGWFIFITVVHFLLIRTGISGPFLFFLSLMWHFWLNP